MKTFNILNNKEIHLAIISLKEYENIFIFTEKNILFFY